MRAVGVISYLRRPFKKNKPKTVTTTVAEQQDAEILIFKELQRSAFKNEIASLSHKEQKPKLTTQSHLLRLDPFIDDQGLIRVGGRLENSTLPFAVKHPIILPRCSHVTELIIDHFHERVKHQRKGMTMNDIHSCGIWIQQPHIFINAYNADDSEDQQKARRWQISLKIEWNLLHPLHTVEWIALGRSQLRKEERN